MNRILRLFLAIAIPLFLGLSMVPVSAAAQAGRLPQQAPSLNAMSSAEQLPGNTVLVTEDGNSASFRCPEGTPYDNTDRLIFRINGNDTTVKNCILGLLRIQWDEQVENIEKEWRDAIEGHELSNFEPLLYLELKKLDVSHELPVIRLRSAGEDKLAFEMEALKVNWEIGIYNAWNPITGLPITIDTGKMDTNINFRGTIALEHDAELGYSVKLLEIEPAIKTNINGSIKWQISVPNPLFAPGPWCWFNPNLLVCKPVVPLDFELKYADVLASTKIDQLITTKAKDKLEEDKNANGVADLREPLRLDNPELFSDAVLDAFLKPIYADLAHSNAIRYSLSSTEAGVPVVEISLAKPITGAWYPDRVEHPRLLYAASERQEMLGRMVQEPYQGWYALIRQEAQETPDFAGSLGTISEQRWQQEEKNARIARSAALVYDLEANSDYLFRALTVLFNFRDRIGDPAFTEDWAQKSLYTSEVLLVMSQTYDLLLGQGFPHNITPSDILQNRMELPFAERLIATSLLRRSGLPAAQGYLQSVAEGKLTKLQTLTYLHTHLWMLVPNLNHTIRNASALGTSALVLNTKPQAYEYLSLAMSAIWKTLGIGAGGPFAEPQLFTKTVEYGGFAEGPAYLNYSAELYLPFMLAYSRFMQGEPSVQTFAYTNWLTQYNIAVPDLLSSERAAAIHEWNLRIATPDGHMPNIKDSDRGATFYYGLLANELSKDSVELKQVWASEFGEPSFSPDDKRLVEHFAYYDHSLAGSPTDPGLVFASPSYFGVEEGNVVMRSGWDSNALYLHLLADHLWDEESSPNVIGGTRYPAHQQEDNTSFVIYAYGDYLAIDSGYGSFPLREYVSKASNHNVVLVDGIGPADSTEAYVINVSESDLVESATVRTEYNDVAVTRRAWMVDNEYFAIMDELSSSTSHSYDWQLHGNNNPDEPGSFQHSQDGFLWTTPQHQQLLVHVTSSAAGGIDSVVEKSAVHFVQHTSNELDLKRHTAIEVHVDQADDLNYLAVLVPSDGATTTFPTITKHAVPGVFVAMGIARTSHVDYVIVRDPQNDAPNIYDVALNGLPSIRTDATMLFLRVDTASKKLIGFFGDTMSFLQYDGKDILTSPACQPPDSGNWEVDTSCTLLESALIAGDVIVGHDVDLTLAPGAELDIDLTQHKLLIRPGGRVIVSPGARLH